MFEKDTQTEERWGVSPAQPAQICRKKLCGHLSVPALH